MFKIKVYTSEKTRDAWLLEALSVYQKRMENQITLEWVVLKNVDKVMQSIESEQLVIGLDPTGKSLDSKEFSVYLFEQLEKGGTKMAWVIGGPEGLTPAIRQKCKGFISLSPMTLTHQMVRLLLVEQIYRALEIRKNSGYHK